tara:strand:+ start:1822 stop:2211 length:390 start_codon:yes stop_codon:yes gene_type:complete
MRVLVVKKERRSVVVNLDHVAVVVDNPEEESLTLKFLDRFEEVFYGPERQEAIYGILKAVGEGMFSGTGLETAFAGEAGHERWQKEKAEVFARIARNAEEAGGEVHGTTASEVVAAMEPEAEAGLAETS